MHHDHHTVRSLIAFIEHQPAGEPYDYSRADRCLLGRYFTAHGYSQVQIGVGFVYHGGGSFRLPAHFDAIAKQDEQTFGAALGRARALVG